METIETVIKTPKEATELGLALAKMVVEVKKMASDGVSAADIPALIALGSSAEVVAGVQGMEKIGDELKENKAAFVAAFVVAGIKLSEDL